jgi:response regulator NasT
MSIRVVIGSSTEKILKQLSQFLIQNGFNVVSATTDGYEFLRKVHTVYPELAIVDYKLKGMNGHELSEILINEKICPVIALISTVEVPYFINLNQEPTFVSIVKPCNKQMLINTINLVIKTSKSINSLQKEVHRLQKNKDSKKIVDKAKKLLMENMNLTEDEAHRRIQKQSMDKGLGKIKIAEAIILMYE